MESRNITELAKEFKRKYPMTIAWRLNKNARVVEKYLRPNEEVLYVFAAQKNNNPFDIFTTAVLALTSERLIIARKRVVFGYFFDSITPDLFNDLKVLSGIIWGKIHIDTVKEHIMLSNIDKKALPEIEKMISSYMNDQKMALSQSLERE